MTTSEKSRKLNLPRGEPGLVVAQARLWLGSLLRWLRDEKAGAIHWELVSEDGYLGTGEVSAPLDVIADHLVRHAPSRPAKSPAPACLIPLCRARAVASLAWACHALLLDLEDARSLCIPELQKARRRACKGFQRLVAAVHRHSDAVSRRKASGCPSNSPGDADTVADRRAALRGPETVCLAAFADGVAHPWSALSLRTTFAARDVLALELPPDWSRRVLKRRLPLVRHLQTYLRVFGFTLAEASLLIDDGRGGTGPQRIDRVRKGTIALLPAVRESVAFCFRHSRAFQACVPTEHVWMEGLIPYGFIHPCVAPSGSGPSSTGPQPRVDGEVSGPSQECGHSLGARKLRLG